MPTIIRLPKRQRRGYAATPTSEDKILLAKLGRVVEAQALQSIPIVALANEFYKLFDAWQLATLSQGTFLQEADVLKDAFSGASVLDLPKIISQASALLDEAAPALNFDSIAMAELCMPDDKMPALPVIDGEEDAEPPETCLYAFERLVFFRHPAPLTKYKELRTLKPLNVIENEDDLALENQYNQTFAAALKELRDFKIMSNDSSATMTDLEDARVWLRFLIENVDLKFEQKLLPFVQKLAGGSVPRLETRTCFTCTETSTVFSSCRCGYNTCRDCFEKALKTANGQQWAGTQSQKLLDEQCMQCSCKMAPSLLTCISRPALELYVAGRTARSSMQSDLRKAHEQIAQEKSMDSLTAQQRWIAGEKDRLIRLTSIRCPTCSATFLDHDACAALTCPRCKQHFCALCQKPSANNAESHDHVRDCTEQHLGERCLFVPSEQYEEFISRRRNAVWNEEVANGAYPPEVREELMKAKPWL